jgi:hypothetical protein
MYFTTILIYYLIYYRSVECSFPPGDDFKHFDLKWVDFEGIIWKPVADDELDARLRDMATKVPKYVSSYYFICVLILLYILPQLLMLLYMCPHTTIFELDARLSDMATNRGLCMCPHSTICVLILLLCQFYIMCPHATMCPICTYILYIHMTRRSLGCVD